MNAPRHHKEGTTGRTDLSLNDPLPDSVSFNLWGNLNKTQANAQDINVGHEVERTNSYAGFHPAECEGVVNKDIHSKPRWEFVPIQTLGFGTGCSRQDNPYTGDTQNTNTSTLMKNMYGREINRFYRQTCGVTWTNGWDSGVTGSSYAQYEHTRNSRMNKGSAGGTEGIFPSSESSDTDLTDTLLHSEVNIPLTLGTGQNLTLGTEWN